MSAAPVLTSSGDREAWLAARRKVITATDVAAILGVHPYRSAHQVFLDKIGMEPEKAETEPMWWGSKMEQAIGEKYAADYALELVPAGFVLDESEPIFGATPDFYILGSPNEILECKVAGEGASRNFGPSETDEVPDHYLCQVMWQLAVTGLKVGRLAVLLSSLTTRTYTIKRDSKLIEHMKHRARIFWYEYVQAENAPPLSGFKPDTDYINAKHPSEEPGAKVVADFEIDKLAHELKIAIDAENAAALKVDELKNQLKQFMGDASILETSSGAFTWKTPAGERVSWKDLALFLKAEFGIPPDKFEAAKAGFCSRYERRFNTPFRSNRA